MQKGFWKTFKNDDDVNLSKGIGALLFKLIKLFTLSYAKK